MSLSILVVDDEKNIRITLKAALEDAGHQVLLAESVATAKPALFKHEKIDLILTDFRLSDQNAIPLIRAWKEEFPQSIIVVMTAFASVDNAIHVMKEGVYDYLPKPFSQSQLAPLLARAEQLVNLRKENCRLQKNRINPFEGFTSPAILRVKEFIKSVADTEQTLLITGESGTGKTELARYIHHLRSEPQGPFVSVYCTTFTESLLESELFGHVKGAFTGAVSDKKGKLELAEKGTLFLDEVGELSLTAQTKLLRFLQERVFERVGGTQLISVNTRVIAATHQNLLDLIEQGKFREDLYYRLNVLEVVLPGLRHRREDLPVLIEQLLKESRTVLPPEVLNFLLSYSWPGNTRELKNTLERLSILSRSHPLTLEDLPPSVLHNRRETLNRLQPKDQLGKAAMTTPPHFATLEELERNHIQEVLQVEPNQEKAAEILGINTTTLWRKRKQYGLP